MSESPSATAADADDFLDSLLEQLDSTGSSTTKQNKEEEKESDGKEKDGGGPEISLDEFEAALEGDDVKKAATTAAAGEISADEFLASLEDEDKKNVVVADDEKKEEEEVAVVETNQEEEGVESAAEKVEEVGEEELKEGGNEGISDKMDEVREEEEEVKEEEVKEEEKEEVNENVEKEEEEKKEEESTDEKVSDRIEETQEEEEVKREEEGKEQRDEKIEDEPSVEKVADEEETKENPEIVEEGEKEKDTKEIESSEDNLAQVTDNNNNFNNNRNKSSDFEEVELNANSDDQKKTAVKSEERILPPPSPPAPSSPSLPPPSPPPSHQPKETSPPKQQQQQQQETKEETSTPRQRSSHPRSGSISSLSLPIPPLPNIHNVEDTLTKGKIVADDEVFVHFVWRARTRHGLRRNLGKPPLPTAEEKKAGIGLKGIVGGVLTSVTHAGESSHHDEKGKQQQQHHSQQKQQQNQQSSEENNNNNNEQQKPSSSSPEWLPLIASTQATKYKRHVLARCQFFKTMLETQWKEAKIVEIGIHESFTSLDAVMAVVDSLEGGGVGGGDFDDFELLAAACLFQLDSLISSLSSSLLSSIDIHSLVHILEISYKFSIFPLIRGARHWLRVFLEATGGRGTTSIHSHDYSLDGRVVLKTLANFPANLFDDLIVDDYIRLGNFLRPRKEYQMFTLVRQSKGGGEGGGGGGKRGDGAVFHLYSEHDAKFVMAVKKMEGKYYLTADINTNDLQNCDDSIIGYLAGNLLSTQFSLFDYHPPPSLCPREYFPSPPQKEIGLVMFGHNILGNSPRSLTAVIPLPKKKSESGKGKGGGGGGEKINSSSEGGGEGGGGGEATDPKLAILKLIDPDRRGKNAREMSIAEKCQKKEFSDLVILNNLPPQWNEKLQAYTMNFFDRVKLPSKKNFQLVLSGKEVGTPFLLFGKMQKNVYALDFRYPISVAQAVMIVLSHFDHHLGVT